MRQINHVTTSIKQHGRVYTPNYLVKIILDFGGYNGSVILRRHVIDNSCGNGAFLTEIVRRYCSIALKNNCAATLKKDLETYIHEIELNGKECEACITNLNDVVKEFGLKDIKWNIIEGDALTIDSFDGAMNYVFGNPPYVRVHNLEDSYKNVKKFKFAEFGMTDLFIVFFEIGFHMLKEDGHMCLITPSSWLTSLAGENLRNYIKTYQNLSGVIDLGHFQAFNATTYTLISHYHKSIKQDCVEYHIFNGEQVLFQERLSYNEIMIGGKFYFSNHDNLDLLKKIKTTISSPYVTVKNGFATLADSAFIGNFRFQDGTIPVLKASTGIWSRCIFPYNKNGNPLSYEEFRKKNDAYHYLQKFSDKLSKKKKDNENSYWYLFGRSQAIKDVAKRKYAINTIIKDKKSIRFELVPEGSGIYSGLYILTEIDSTIIKETIISDDFINYIHLLKNYKSGGYYTFSSKDLEQFLNYKLTKKYGQSRISNGSRKLF